MSDQQVADTGGGFLVGTDPPRQPVTQADLQQPTQQQAPVNIGNGNGQPPQQQGRWFSEEDVARIRTEEKDKLYGRLNDMDGELKALREDREKREAAMAAEQERLANEAKSKEEEAMDVRQLLERKDQEWKTQIEGLRGEQERERAIFEQERHYAQVQDYRRARVEQEGNEIMPELRDLVTGGTEAEVEAAIEIMKQRTTAILQSVMAAQQPLQQARPLAPRGVATTGQPPVGPMEQQTATETLSVEDIKRMDPKTYAQYRDRLMAVVSKAGPQGLKQQ